MPDPVLPHGHEQRRSAIAPTDGRVEPAANGEFRRRLHDVVDHAALPYGYILAPGSGSAVLATTHGGFGTVQALPFLLGAGFALIALIAAGRCRPARCPPPGQRRSGTSEPPGALAAAWATAHALDGLLAYFATGLVVTTIYFVGAAVRASTAFRWLLRP